MLPIPQIEIFLNRIPGDLRDIVFELRNLIASAAPDAVEVVRWGGLGYYHEGRGGLVSAGICQIGLERDHIRLAFIHGVFLPDPRGLLEGTRIAKRHVRIQSYDEAPWDDLKKLIIAAARFDPHSLRA